MRSALALLPDVVLRPARGFDELQARAPRQRMLIGASAVVGLGAIYTVTVVLLQTGGARPVVEPILPISRERYYTWLAFLTLPTFAAMWLLFSAAAGRAASMLGDRGVRADARAATGIALSVPVFVTMWIPETIMAVLLVTGRCSWSAMQDWNGTVAGQTIHLARQTGGVAWMIGLAALATGRAYALTASRACISALAGFVPAALLVALVIR